MTERNRYNQHSGNWYHNHMQQQCSSCGTLYDGFHCPKCSSKSVGSPSSVHTIEVTCLDCGHKWWDFGKYPCPECHGENTDWGKGEKDDRKG